jgi:hypothetical protein
MVWGWIACVVRDNRNDKFSSRLYVLGKTEVGKQGPDCGEWAAVLDQQAGYWWEQSENICKRLFSYKGQNQEGFAWEESQRMTRLTKVS